MFSSMQSLNSRASKSVLFLKRKRKLVRLVALDSTPSNRSFASISFVDYGLNGDLSDKVAISKTYHDDETSFSVLW